MTLRNRLKETAAKKAEANPQTKGVMRKRDGVVQAPELQRDVTEIGQEHQRRKSHPLNQGLI